MWSSARLPLLLVGAAALWWSSAVFPIFRSAAPVREIAERLLADQRFKPEALSEALDRMQHEPLRAVKDPTFSRAVALVGLSVAERAAARRSPEEADFEVAAAEARVRLSLALNPTDSLLWLMTYSVQTARTGFSAENVRYLEQSYASGPHEGWIALRRNRLALSIFQVLTLSVQQRVVSEFAELVDSDMNDVAATNLVTVGWLYRERLLDALQDVDIASKKNLKKELLANGVKLAIPGIDLEDRPWR
ncbi:hypothetical protein ACVWZK_007941 [Bradyrhizobium sp. GM0.4]